MKKNKNRKRKAGRPRNLSPIEEQIVFEMHRKGKPIAEIAYLNKISVSTVHRIIKRIKEEGGLKPLNI